MREKKQGFRPFTRRALVGLALLLSVSLAVSQLAFAQPPSWRPTTAIIADKDVITVGECVRYTVTVTNPSPTGEAASPLPSGATWYNITLAVPIDPALSIEAASSTMGTAEIVGQSVVVNGGIDLAPLEFFLVYIDCCSVGIAPKTTVTDAYVEYENEQGEAQDPIQTTEPAVVEIFEEPVPFVPEASTLILMGSAATGLTGYVGMQIRARRRKKDEA